jgi:hypothetical protein
MARRRRVSTLLGPWLLAVWLLLCQMLVAGSLSSKVLISAYTADSTPPNLPMPPIPTLHTSESAINTSPRPLSSSPSPVSVPVGMNKPRDINIIDCSLHRLSGQEGKNEACAGIAARLFRGLDNLSTEVSLTHRITAPNHPIDKAAIRLNAIVLDPPTTDAADVEEYGHKWRDVVRKRLFELFELMTTPRTGRRGQTASSAVSTSKSLIQTSVITGRADASIDERVSLPRICVFVVGAQQGVGRDIVDSIEESAQDAWSMFGTTHAFVPPKVRV